MPTTHSKPVKSRYTKIDFYFKDYRPMKCTSTAQIGVIYKVNTNTHLYV